MLGTYVDGRPLMGLFSAFHTQFGAPTGNFVLGGRAGLDFTGFQVDVGAWSPSKGVDETSEPVVTLELIVALVFGASAF